MIEKERYEQLCRPMFERQQRDNNDTQGKLDTILGLLQGKDGEPGLCERLRCVERKIVPDLEPRLDKLVGAYKSVIGAVILAVGAIVAQAGQWVWSKLSGQ